MAIDFPNSPTNGQTYSVGDKMWTYNSADNKWLLSSVSPDSGTLTTKGDLLTRSSSAITRLGAGSNGDLLVADSGATEGLRWQGQTNTGRNLVINGAMQVAQRGTSATGLTALTYRTADRWTGFAATAGTWTQSVENDGPTGSGLRKSLKMLCTTANNSLSASSEMSIFQVLEGQDCQRILKGSSSAQQLNLSFWVKSNQTGTYIAEVKDEDNTRHVCSSYTVSVANTWERKTISLPADTTGVLDNDNAASLTVGFWLVAGSNFTSGTLSTSWASTSSANRAVGQVNLAAATNNYWQVTGVQLEVGPVATGFDFEPYETTLRKCQRYYWRSTGPNAYSSYGIGYFTSATTSQVSIKNPVALRAYPSSLDYSSLTVQDSNGAIGSLFAVTSLTIDQASLLHNNCEAQVATGGTANRPIRLLNNNNAAGYVGFNAEL